MIYRRLDDNGDFILGGGDSEFLSDVEAVAQAIITRIKLLQQEWWENLIEGTPLWQRILGSPAGEASIKAIDSILIKRIIDTQKVNEVKSYESSFDPQTRKYTFQATVNTEYGIVEIEEVL